MITKEEIKNNVEKWVVEKLALDFQFREYQEDAIINTIFNIVNDEEYNQIIEAPTGSGKSIICLITAGVLATYYNKTSYILCSDLYLWSQYEDFIQKYNLNFGILKGARGNYVCNENNQDITLGVCRIEGVGWKTICNHDLAIHKGFGCVDTCEYAIQRSKAEKSRVCVMTYALWYAQMNIVEPDGHGMKAFMKRDVLFCDECHKIPELFSNFASPTIDPIRNFPSYIDVFEYQKSVAMPGEMPDISKDEFHQQLLQAFENIWNAETQEDIFNCFSKYLSVLNILGELDEVASQLRRNVKDAKNLKKSEIKMLSHIEHIHNMRCHISDFLKAIEESGLQYLVKNNNISTKNGDRSVTLMCAKEDFLCAKYMFSNTKYTVMLSATVGQKEAFDENIGIALTNSKKSSMIRIPSTFDFSSSPIYYFTKWNMGFSNIQANFPEVANAIFNIIRTYHSNQCGIIQTGSYSNAKQLYDMCPQDLKKRFYCYSNKTEKEEFLRLLDGKKDAVIIGPTLVEGIDLPNDLCRFIFIMKVPWPSLADNLTKKKMKLFPKWYEDHTSKMIIQGIGRGNRHKDDWCVSYIMDNCFSSLYRHTQDEYPNEFKNRIKWVQ